MEGLKSLATVSYSALRGATWASHLTVDTLRDMCAYDNRVSKSTKFTIANLKLADATTVFTAQTWGFSNTTLICGELLSAGVVLGASYFGCTSKFYNVPVITFLMNIVNIIALLYLGNIMTGVAVCGTLTIVVLAILGKLPASVNKAVLYALKNKWIMTTAGIVATSGIMQLRLVVKLVLLVTEKMDWYTPPKTVRKLL